MIDYRQFLNEFSEKDYKEKVIKSFAAFLDKKLNTDYNPSTDKYENDYLWWAIGDGNGAYKDRRLTVGTKGSSLTDNNQYKTLVFMVDNDFNLLAYLDAEDNDLLNNTELLTKAPENGIKPTARWFVSGSVENREKVFNAALGIINKFFADNDLLYTTVDDTVAGYTDAEKARLEKQIDSNGDYVYLTWNKSDELQLQDLKFRRRKLNKAIKLMTDEMDDLTAVVKDPTSSDEEIANAKKEQKAITDQYFEVKKQLDAIKMDIKDLEEDKVQYLKFKGKTAHLTDREQQELRAIKNKELQGLAARNDVIFSDDDMKSFSDANVQQMLDQLKGGPETFAANTRLRKPRATKTGDVKDARAAKAKTNASNFRAEMKAKKDAEKAKKAADKQKNLDDLIASLTAGY